MPPVNVMIKPASGLCNMRCTYCFYADEMDKRTERSYGIMSEETLENVLRKVLAFAEGDVTVAYQGGEPTLAGLDFFKKSIALEKKYNEKGLRIHHALQTNGYQLDDDWCSFFHENEFLIGLSVDGIRATHNAYRKDAAGADTFDRVMETAARLTRHGVEFNILTVVNARTALRIRRIYEEYRKAGFRYQQYIQCLDPLGEAQGSHDYSLTPEVYGQFLIDLFDLWNQDLEQGKQPYIRQFENWVAILLGYQPEACDQQGVCNIQNIVEADGSVYPCDFYALDAYRIGNLNEDSMEEIYGKRLESGFLEASRNHSEKCRSCPYFALCRGGCRRHRAFMDGAYENVFCAGYKMFFDRYYGRLLEIARRLRGVS
ncbi:MAG: anaerobic sulfatase maturase [Lachnospiraceae bacterium]|nr:anaerobic sulfatase maturase [Lachnospiraceae bacterium]